MFLSKQDEKYLMDNSISKQDRFIFATMHGCKGMVEHFIEDDGVDINYKDDQGNTALYYAVYFRWFDIAELLIEKGADIKAINNKGESILGAIIKYDENTMKEIKHLIEAGATL